MSLAELMFTISVNNSIYKNKDITNKFLGKKVGDIITFSAKELYVEETEELNQEDWKKSNEWLRYLEIHTENINEENQEISFTISQINGYQPAEITQEILDKVYEKGEFKSLEELEQKIRTIYEEEYKSYTEPKFFNDTFDILIENTKFDLPDAFLKKWIQQSTENPITDEQAEQEYNNSKEKLQRQLIEEKIIKQNNLVVTSEEIKDFAFLKTKVELYKKYRGNVSVEQIEKEAEQKAKQLLSDTNEIQNLSKSIINNKLFDLFIEKTNPEIKEVSLEEFIRTYNKETDS